MLTATKIRFGFVQLRKTNAKLRSFIDLMNLLCYNRIVFLYFKKLFNFGGMKMRISYKKLWVLLAQREMTKAEFRKHADIAPATLTKLNKNEIVAMPILIKICEKLDCDLSDIVELVKKED